MLSAEIVGQAIPCSFIFSVDSSRTSRNPVFRSLAFLTSRFGNLFKRRGREISLISEEEADKLGGTSEVTEEDSVKVKATWS